MKSSTRTRLTACTPHCAIPTAAAAQPLLQRLAAATTPASDTLLAQQGVSGRESLLAQAARRPAPPSKLFAAITPGRWPDQPGFVLDYLTLNTTKNNYIFQNDTT